MQPLSQSAASYTAAGPFASKNPNLPMLPNDLFDHIFTFLEPKDVVEAEKVCKSWNRFIKEATPWKTECQSLLNLPSNVDPMPYLPKDSPSYKTAFQNIWSRVIGPQYYKYYLGAEIGSVPRMPESIASRLRQWNQIDPLNEETAPKTVGESYYWVYFPPHLEIALPANSNLHLKRPEYPGNEDQLIEIKPTLKERIARTFQRTQTIRNLKIPLTINNAIKLFEKPKNGNPATCNFWPDAADLMGNKKIPSGWFCIREEGFGENLPIERNERIKNVGAMIPKLCHWMAFNFLLHVKTNKYPGEARELPEDEDVLTYTSTETLFARIISFSATWHYTTQPNLLCSGRIIRTDRRAAAIAFSGETVEEEKEPIRRS